MEMLDRKIAGIIQNRRRIYCVVDFFQTVNKFYRKDTQKE